MMRVVPTVSLGMMHVVHVVPTVSSGMHDACGANRQLGHDACGC
jgi:hypothetical protein